MTGRHKNKMEVIGIISITRAIGRLVSKHTRDDPDSRKELCSIAPVHNKFLSKILGLCSRGSRRAGSRQIQIASSPRSFRGTDKLGPPMQKRASFNLDAESDEDRKQLGKNQQYRSKT